jgi:hypothetical protein
MSAAHPASQAVRRTPAAPATRPSAPAPAVSQRPARAAQSNTLKFASPDTEDEIRVNLSDVPIVRPTLDEDIFKPSLFSRLFGLISSGK